MPLLLVFGVVAGFLVLLTPGLWLVQTDCLHTHAHTNPPVRSAVAAAALAARGSPPLGPALPPQAMPVAVQTAHVRSPGPHRPPPAAARPAAPHSVWQALCAAGTGLLALLAAIILPRRRPVVLGAMATSGTRYEDWQRAYGTGDPRGSAGPSPHPTPDTTGDANAERWGNDARHPMPPPGDFVRLVAQLERGPTAQREEAARVLAELGGCGTANQAAIHDAGAVEPLVALLSTGAEGVQVAAASALAAIADCCADGGARGSMREDSGVAAAAGALVSCLAQSGPPRLREAATVALANLTAAGVSRARIVVEAGALDALFEAVRCGTRRQQLEAARALANIYAAPGAASSAGGGAEGESAEPLDARAGGVARAVSGTVGQWSPGPLDQGHRGDEDVCRCPAAAEALLQMLCTRHGRGNADAVRVLGVLEARHSGAVQPAIAAVVEPWVARARGGDEGEQMEAARALENLLHCDGVAGLRPALTAAIGPLGELMRSGTEPVHLAAARALTALMHWDDEDMIITVAAAVDAIVALVRSGGDDVKEEAARALASVAGGGGRGTDGADALVLVACAAGAIEPLVSLVSTGTCSQKEAAAGALAAVARSGAGREGLVLAGAVQPLAALLSSGTEGAKAEAARAMARVCTATPVALMFAIAGAVTPLVELLRSDAEGQRLAALGAVAGLAQCDDFSIHERLSAAGVLEPVVKLLASPHAQAEAARALRYLAVRPGNRAELVRMHSASLMLMHIAYCEDDAVSADAKREASLALEIINVRRPTTRPQPWP